MTLSATIVEGPDRRASEVSPASASFLESPCAVSSVAAVRAINSNPRAEASLSKVLNSLRPFSKLS